MEASEGASNGATKLKEKIRLATGHAHAFHRASALATIDNGYSRGEGLLKVDLLTTSETYPDGLPDRVIATMGEVLTQYTKIVKKVLKGIVRGYRFARDSKNATKMRKV